jgi:hypothetical protein
VQAAAAAAEAQASQQRGQGLERVRALVREPEPGQGARTLGAIRRCVHSFRFALPRSPAAHLANLRTLQFMPGQKAGAAKEESKVASSSSSAVAAS